MRIWLIASAFLSIVAIALWLISNIRDVRLTFARHGVLWELTCQSGRLALDNEPQRDREAGRFDTLSSAVEEQYSAQQRAHLLMQQAGARNNDAYRKSLSELNRLREERQRLRVLGPEAPPTTPRAE